MHAMLDFSKFCKWALNLKWIIVLTSASNQTCMDMNIKVAHMQSDKRAYQVRSFLQVYLNEYPIPLELSYPGITDLSDPSKICKSF